ncbi:MAG: heavy-metal-associated domain-containing protein [Saprospiraceae bacterium]
MKLVFTLLTACLLSVFTLSSSTNLDEVTSSFKVNGNCGMCKKKIETSLRVKGVKKVNWDMKSHELSITYSPDKITLDEIHLRIAAVGYDTDKVKASDEAYAKLDDCCKYDRVNN